MPNLSLALSELAIISLVACGGGSSAPPVATSLQVSGPSAAPTAMVAWGITVTVRDQSGNPFTSYSGTVHFSSTDLTAQLPPDYTFEAADAGTHAFPITFHTGGTQAVTVTDLATASVTGHLAVAVCAPPAGVAGWWRGDGNGTDLIGGDTATGANGATFASGLTGQAFALDGVSSYFSAPDKSSLNPTAALTVSAWVHRQAFVGAFDPIVKKAGAASGYAMEFGSIGEQDALKFWVYLDSSGWTESPPAPLSLGVWAHVAGVYDGTTIRLYVDGTEAGSKVASGSIVPSAMDLEFGRDPLNIYRHYSGLIDDVTIYGRALTAMEISRAAAARTGFCP
jgi:hypothetical protein